MGRSPISGHGEADHAALVGDLRVGSDVRRGAVECGQEARSRLRLNDGAQGYLDSSLDLGAGTGTSRDSEAMLILVGPDMFAGVSCSRVGEGHAASKNPWTAAGGVKVRAPSDTQGDLDTTESEQTRTG